MVLDILNRIICLKSAESKEDYTVRNRNSAARENDILFSSNYSKSPFPRFGGTAVISEREFPMRCKSFDSQMSPSPSKICLALTVNRHPYNWNLFMFHNRRRPCLVIERICVNY
ncbi:hypothetical protein CDAR_531551 [Caerostris darwini]|uniref:Ycf15 n=1 Tax=Caerostris darwini TaxID=1538125 RepID=A0AAV4QY92_9ARAC|nr:hypothetical protein CDAR_531551 [Caerostris darwini]